MNVYEKTIDRFNTQGWLQAKPCDEDGKSCLLGGLLLSSGYNINDILDHDVAVYDDTQYTDKIAGIIKEKFPDWFNDFFPSNIYSSSNVCYEFNDSHDFDDVLSVLEKAAVSEGI